MAYILGFVVADGCIIKRKNRKNSYIFNITSKDIDHLGEIKKFLSWENKIKKKTSGYTGRKDNYFLQSCNREVCEDLISLGIKPNKTHNLQPIDMPRGYFSDFARGFFDGDGTVFIYKVNGAPQIKVSFGCASYVFMKDFNKNLCQDLRIPEKTVHTKNPGPGKNLFLYYTYFYVDDCEKIYRFMYGNNPSLYLTRKRKVFERWQFVERHSYVKKNYPSKIGWQLKQKISA